MSMEQTLLVTSIVLLWVIVLFNLVLTLGVARRFNTSTSKTIDINAGRLQPGDAAPPFRAKTLEGQEVSLETYAGKSVAFHFLSAYCEPCRRILPKFVELVSIAAASDVQFVFVLFDEGQPLQPFVDEFQIPAPILVIPRPEETRADEDFAADYKSMRTPSFCLIDEQGLVVAAGHPGTEAGKAWEKIWRKNYTRTVASTAVERG